MTGGGASAPDPVRTSAPDGRPMDAQPKWRRDFPIDSDQDDFVSRRELVKFLVLTSGAFVAGQVWLLVRHLIGRPPLPPAAEAVAAVDDVPVGGALTFTYPSGSPPRLLVRTSASDFVAYDQQCTHLLCPVVAEVERGRFHCPCHNGNFDLETGRVLSGPPPRPLARIRLEVRRGVLYATGVEERT